MPITLGCPSCGKRFRAREESAGKKVKCPFCQAAVPVPTAEESQIASTEALPPPSPASGTVTFAGVAPQSPPTAPVSASSPDSWGATGGAPKPPAPPIPFAAQPEPFLPLPSPTGPRPRPLSTPSSPSPVKGAKTPDEQNMAAWKKCRGGLGTVLMGLFWIALLGFIPAGKVVYERSVGPLPAGDGADWVKLDGVINTPGENAIQLDQTELLNLALYGLPVLFGGMALSFGRVTAGAVPRNSGAKGLFVFSGLITLLALAGYITYVVCERVAYREIGGYGLWTARIGGALGEFWFLLALAAAGATLKRPASVRTVGFLSLVIGLGVALYFIGWDVLLTKLGPEIGRPKRPEPGTEWVYYEAAAVLLGWLILIGTYWRAVRGVRTAISEYTKN